MNEQRRVLLLILIMPIITLLVSGSSILLLYQAAFEEEKMRLRETIKERVVADVQNFIGRQPLHDDLTLIVVKQL